VIILSVGMPRAGSGWYYNLTHDLVTATGGQDARLIRQRYRLQNILTEVNCNIGALTVRRLLGVLLPSLLGNTFAIKAHAGLTPFALFLIRQDFMQAAYIYRDPRDALLSAFENGQRAIEKGSPNAFSQLVDFDASLNFMMNYVRIWETWVKCPQALHSRYEDLLTNYDEESGRLVGFLKLARESQIIRDVLEKYRPEQARSDQKGLHFRQGKIGRFRQKLSTEQQEIMAQRFGPYLSRMGYEE